MSVNRVLVYLQGLTPQQRLIQARCLCEQIEESFPDVLWLNVIERPGEQLLIEWGLNVAFTPLETATGLHQHVAGVLKEFSAILYEMGDAIEGGAA